MDTFDFPHNASVNGSTTYRSINVQFGDGYSQGAPDGINAEERELNIECVYLTIAQAQALDTFLKNHGGHRPFFFTPNDGRNVQGKYIVVQPVQDTVQRGGGTTPYWYSRQLKFKRVYR
jgi:phage-related protein